MGRRVWCQTIVQLLFIVPFGLIVDVSTTSMSAGVIETVDFPSYCYPFNGHGEYVFLRSDKGFDIQARREYLVSGNIDSTIFTAFVFTDVSTDGTFMNIKVTSRPALTNMTGLAGNVRNGYYFSQNGTRYAVNASEHDMFDYGESWSLRHDRSLSNFNYNLTDGEFRYYNTFSRPRFLEYLLGNYTVLFGQCHGSNISTFVETCTHSWENATNKECMLTIARTCNMTVGETIHYEVERQHEDFLRRTNKPPYFLDTMPLATRVIYNGNTTWTINLSTLVQDEEMNCLRFHLEPMINEIKIVGDIFEWTVGTTLRYINGRTIRFEVYDKYNMSDDYSVSFRYCGCEEPSECVFESQENYTAECKCPNRFVTGAFCEIKKDPCVEYNCYEPDRCNTSYSGDGSPCARCRAGYYEEIVGTSQHCIDLNECNDTLINDCEHVCHNDAGSYHCSCVSGYMLTLDNKMCSDIDECKTGHVLCHKPHEVCMNLPGHYSCICDVGYNRTTSDAECKKIDGFMYFGYLEYVITSQQTPTNETLQAGIKLSSKIFEVNLASTADFLGIELYKAYFKDLFFHFDVIVYMSSTFELTEVRKRIKDSLSGKYMQLTSPSLYLGYSVSVHIHGTNEGGLCDVEPKRVDCLEQSTYCVNKNISDDYYDCACRFGYAKPISARNREIYCEDVNECQLFAENGTSNERCVHGLLCVNTIGYWNCTCPPDRLWMSVGTAEYPVYRCQGNHSYLGNVTILWNGRKSYENETLIKDVLETQLRHVFENATLDPESNSSLSITTLFVSVTVLERSSSLRSAFGDLYMFTYGFNVRMGDPMDTSRLQAMLDRGINHGMTVGAAEFQNVTIFQEKDNILCQQTNNGNCDPGSSFCTQINGNTKCECKNGFQIHPYDTFSCLGSTTGAPPTNGSTTVVPPTTGKAAQTQKPVNMDAAGQSQKPLNSAETIAFGKLSYSVDTIIHINISRFQKDILLQNPGINTGTLSSGNPLMDLLRQLGCLEGQTQNRVSSTINQSGREDRRDSKGIS